MRRVCLFKHGRQRSMVYHLFLSILCHRVFLHGLFELSPVDDFFTVVLIVILLENHLILLEVWRKNFIENDVGQLRWENLLPAFLLNHLILIGTLHHGFQTCILQFLVALVTMPLLQRRLDHFLVHFQFRIMLVFNICSLILILVKKWAASWLIICINIRLYQPIWNFDDLERFGGINSLNIEVFITAGVTVWIAHTQKLRDSAELLIWVLEKWSDYLVIHVGRCI